MLGVYINDIIGLKKHTGKKEEMRAKSWILGQPPSHHLYFVFQTLLILWQNIQMMQLFDKRRWGIDSW